MDEDCSDWDDTAKDTVPAHLRALYDEAMSMVRDLPTIEELTREIDAPDYLSTIMHKFDELAHAFEDHVIGARGAEYVVPLPKNVGSTDRPTDDE